MFTIRKEIDILHDNDLIAVGRTVVFRKGLVQKLRQLMIRVIHTGKDFFIHLGYAFRRFHETLPIGIFAEGDENAADMFFYCFRINHVIHLVFADPKSPCGFGFADAHHSVCAVS